MNDFNKLDQFMHAHKPTIEKMGPARYQPKRSWVIPGVGLACAAMLAIFVMVKSEQQSLDEEALAMMETMEWDYTADEIPSEVSELVAIAE